VSEIVGVIAAVLSSGLGGTAVGATRYVVGATDPLTLGAFRFGVGFIFLLPIAVLQGGSWPAKSDWPRVFGLGLLFFGAFPVLFNSSLIFTTAARGALALSTLPVLTMVVAAIIGIEPLTGRKTLGVFIAMAGVATALLSGLATSPPGAWRGDLLMVGAAICMALYSIWSRPVIQRSGPIRFTTMAMAVGAVFLVAVSAARGGFASVAAFDMPQWLAIGYLGIFGSALTFFLWAFALGRTTPTKVAISVTVNPVTASLVGAILLGEPIRWNTILGLLMVFLGIWIATKVDEAPHAAVSATATG
jgi:drug/metabolite transporter (DMT)-like permease